MSPERRSVRASQPDRAAARPHIAEWFGHRIFPAVSASDASVDDQRAGRCPFLTQTLKRNAPCVKAPNSRGVCTISASSNGPRQDWLVCPYRALDDGLLADMVCRLYGIPPLDAVLIRPVVALDEEAGRAEILSAVQGPDRVFVYFQDKLGGEISLARTGASPELSFDITVVELLPARSDALTDVPSEPAISVGNYGVIELQTTDTHGSYGRAVKALNDALDLHTNHFPEQLAQNPEWAGRSFAKDRTFQTFSSAPSTRSPLSFRSQSATPRLLCALALPKPVWDSWQPFLGAPELHELPDGTWRSLDDQETQPSDWIYVFDIDTEPGPNGHPAPIRVSLVIGTDAATLSRAAFEIAPARAIAHGGEHDAVIETITRRLGRYLSTIS